MHAERAAALLRDQGVGNVICMCSLAPLPQQDHALRGMVCGVQMQREHQRWVQQREAEGLPAPLAGVGLAAGSAVVGNIGTPGRSRSWRL